MSYTLGLDVGTTWTVAAINDGTTLDSFTHPSGEIAIPSVVALDEQQQFLVGEPATRHATVEPSAVAREFKRRFGDSTPLLLRGTPIAATELTIQLATSVVKTATNQLGEAPQEIVVSHPAAWGGYKAGLLTEVLAASSLPPHQLVSEPIAVANHASTGTENVVPGTRVVVYDIGGSTCDISILEFGDGWQHLGRPGGLERLGGADFDTALFGHVLEAIEVDLEQWNADDPATQLAVGRLREACNNAKHRLSIYGEAEVAVALPGFDRTTTIDRPTYESLIEPLIDRSLEALDSTVSQAGISLSDLDNIILAGGSSPTPLIGQKLTSHTARPLQLAADPRLATAYGAATFQSPAAEPAELPQQNFPSVPDMKSEPPPDFLQHTTVVDPALPKPAPVVAPPPVPALPTTQALPVTQPVAAPPVPNEPKRRTPWLVTIAIVLAVIALVSAFMVSNRDDPVATSPGASLNSTTVITVEPSITPASSTDSTDSTPVVNLGCDTTQQPSVDADYRVVKIPSNDPDGGLNGRAEPSLSAQVVTVFPSEGPVDIVGRDCAVDSSDRVWWVALASAQNGATQTQRVWVARNFIEER